ncbi:MAG: hypothetical protein PHY08_11170 [Candidatus Cloacimonetes bacterium]|jgi:hypothetical protein|nr:hypothetical protein [Candidatus Cloacimonadota bacterium]MDD4157123.1 hypothetical protein [Candidatus Cloacimonadota bacterium]
MKNQRENASSIKLIKELWDYLIFAYDIKTLSGRFGNFVFYSFEKTRKTYLRTYRYPNLTTQNHLNGRKIQFASLLWKQVNNDFKADLNEYAKMFHRQYRQNKSLYITGYNIFSKCILKITHPVNTLEELQEIAGNTINQWILNAYLDKLDSEINFTTHLIKP